MPSFPFPTFRLAHAVRAGLLAAISLALPAAAQVTRTPEQVMIRYCYDCHGDGLRRGDMALDRLLELDDPVARHHGWVSAWKMVRQELMPPVEEDQPTPEERRMLAHWIEQAMLGVDHDNPDPGRVTVRRLNRMEYEYSISDLFGASLSSEGTFSADAAIARMSLREKLPPDDTAFGFDTIGDFQTLSPALLDRYFELAEFIVGEVISFDGPEFPSRSLADDLRIERPEHPDGLRIAEHRLPIELAAPGRYQVEVRFSLGGWREFGGAFDFRLAVNGQDLSREEIEVGGQKTHLYQHELTLDEGAHELTMTTVALKPDSDERWVHLELRPRITLIGPLDESAAAYPATHQRIFFRGEAPEGLLERHDYAKEILRRIADQAFRRPIDEVRLERLADLALSHDESFERGVGQAITAILTSPRFLYRTETQPQPDDPTEIHPIDEYSLASRLSHLLWLSMPDAELRDLAGRGELREQLPQQLERMLADPRSARFFEDFPGQWLRTRNVLMTPISRRDGEINHLRGAMKRETEMLFEHIAREDRDLLELITADYTFVDRPLAEFYGLPWPGGRGFQRVDLAADSNRGGLLTHGSFLIGTSNPNRTSPVKRGLFVLENLLAAEPPPPPPDIPALEEDTRRGGGPALTVRQQLEIHREDPSCASCHAHFDPIGLVLEHYDLTGRWRETEAGQPIIIDERTATGDPLTSVEDLREWFRNHRERFYRGTTEKFMTYALGRGMEPAAAVTIDRITAQLMEDGGKFSTLLVEVVDSPAFQLRRGDDGRVLESPRAHLPEPPPPEQRRGRPGRAAAVAEAAIAARLAAEAAEAESLSQDPPADDEPAANPSPSPEP